MCLVKIFLDFYSSSVMLCMTVYYAFALSRLSIGVPFLCLSLAYFLCRLECAGTLGNMLLLYFRLATFRLFDHFFKLANWHPYFDSCEPLSINRR